MRFFVWLLVYARAVVRVLVARWHLRRMTASIIHFVPIPEHDPEMMPAAALDREALCGGYPHELPGECTVQPNIVSCFGCAVAIEADRDRWAPVRLREAVVGEGSTYCKACGHLDDSPPGCSCPTRAPWWAHTIGKSFIQAQPSDSGSTAG